MKEQQLIKKLDKIVNLYQRLTSATDKANEAGCLEIDGPLFNAIFIAFEGMLNIIEESFNALDWINWYIYENQCGEKQLEAKSSSMQSLQKICNTRDLAKLILNEDDNWN